MIVGVDSNESVRTYKDNRRPIIDEYERLAIVNGIKGVNFVFRKHIKLDSANRINLIKNLNTDYVVFGCDFPIEDELCSNVFDAGATAVKFPTKVDHSTTETIKRIINKYAPEASRKLCDHY